MLCARCRLVRWKVKAYNRAVDIINGDPDENGRRRVNFPFGYLLGDANNTGKLRSETVTDTKRVGEGSVTREPLREWDYKFPYGEFDDLRIPR